jgi:hypothetical protein
MPTATSPCVRQQSLTPSSSRTIADRNQTFLKLLPIIRRHARIHYRHLPAVEREEAVQEIVVSSFVAFTRLCERRKQHCAFGTPLAVYAAAQFNAGRRVAMSLNRRDVTSVYCQRRTGVTVRSLTRWIEQDEEWDEMIVEDRRATPADIAMLRIDFWAWLASLSRRDRWIAWLLAMGEAVRDIANRFGLTPGRISQMRRELCDSWQVFVADVAKTQLDLART